MKSKGNMFLCVIVLCGIAAALCGCTRRTGNTDSLDEWMLSENVVSEETSQGILSAETDGAVTAEEAFSAAGMSVGRQAEDEMTDVSEMSDCYVYICGAVEKPGVYRMEPDERVYAVIEKAGGFLETACEDYVNQAKKIADGLKIWIPTVEEAEELNVRGMQGTGSSGPDGNAGLEYPAGAEDNTASAGGGPAAVNINTAGKEQLCQLTGIGEAKAQAIIAYRSQHGNFLKKEDIMNVAGIKQSGYDKIKDQITVNQE